MLHDVAVYVKKLTTSHEIASAPAPAPAPSPSAIHELEDLTSLLDSWMFTDDFAVMIGNTKYGTVYNYTHGNFSLHTPVETASTSKWPLAMTLAGLIPARRPNRQCVRLWLQDVSSPLNSPIAVQVWSMTAQYPRSTPR